MKYLRKSWLYLVLISILSAILFSTMAFAEVDININNDNIIRKP